VGPRVQLLLNGIAEREGEQPERGLLVRGQLGELVDRVFDFAERLACLDLLQDCVPVAGPEPAFVGSRSSAAPFSRSRRLP
jgi:hypothetical protein